MVCNPSRTSPVWAVWMGCSSQGKPSSALVLHRLQFLQDMATCSGMEPSTSCRVDNCSIPGLCHGLERKFLLWYLKCLSPFFSGLSVTGFLTLLFPSLTPMCRMLLSQQCCCHGWGLSCALCSLLSASCNPLCWHGAALASPREFSLGTPSATYTSY